MVLNNKEYAETHSCNLDPPENTAHNRWFYQIHVPVIYSSLHITRTCQLRPQNQPISCQIYP